MKKGASSIGSVAKDVMGRLAERRGSGQERANRAWEKAAGKRFTRHARPASFRKKRLVVNVDSSGWLFELTMKKREISAKLAGLLKSDFKELRFRIGDVEK